MKILELADKKIFSRMLSNSGPFCKEDLELQPSLVRGSTKDIKKIINEEADDTLVILRQNLHQNSLKNGGSVDTSTAFLREFISRPCHRSLGRNLGLVVLSHPDQDWIDKSTKSKYQFKFKKVASVDNDSRAYLLMEDSKDDKKIVLATRRQAENLDEQIASIANHFAELIQSK